MYLYLKTKGYEQGIVCRYIKEGNKYKLHEYFGTRVMCLEPVELWKSEEIIFEYMYLLAGDEYDEVKDWVPTRKHMENSKICSGIISKATESFCYNDYVYMDLVIEEKQENEKD